MTCAHCLVEMPRDPDGHEIPTDWSVIRIEKHGRKYLDVKYHYLCPSCTITFCSRQTNLLPPTKDKVIAP